MLSAGQVAGASLLVDYILTVAVSVCAGVRAVTSIPQLQSLTNERVLLCIGAIALITVANLRGIKESGRIFALPTYLYIVMLTGLVTWGLVHEFSLFGLHPFPTISFFNVTKDLPPAQIAALHK